MKEQRRELEVTVRSAQGLTNVSLLGDAMDPYCVAWVDPHTKVAGAVSKRGGANPTWNSIIKLLVDDSMLAEQGDAAVTVDIYHHGRFSNRLIGSAAIPMRDVITDVNAAKPGSTVGSKSAAYQVRRKSGRHHGVINVAVKARKLLSEAEAAKRLPPTIGVPAAMGKAAGGQYRSQSRYSQQAATMGMQGLGTGLLLGSALNGGCGLGGCGGVGGFGGVGSC